MIHALLKYADDRGLVSKPGYTKKAVKWVLAFDEFGERFTGLLRSDKEFTYAPDLSQPELLALKGLKGQASHFLVAPLGSFLGWGKDDVAEDGERRRRDTLTWMLKEASATESGFLALSRLLQNDEIAQLMRQQALSLKPAAKPTDLATIRLGDRYPAEETSWHSWWDSFRDTLGKGGARTGMVSFASGESITPVDTHPKLTKLSGVGLSQPHAPIITFDKEAFESYGLQKAQNAAMDDEAAKAYVAALDHLLEKSIIYCWRRSGPKSPKRLEADYARLGGVRLIYWYIGTVKERGEVEEHNDLISATLGGVGKEDVAPENPDEERILIESRLRKIIERVRTGETAHAVSTVRFCVLALSGAGGRVMVRDFFEGTVLDLAESVERWFKDLSLVTFRGNPGGAPGLEEVITAPLPDKKRDQDYLKWVAPAGAWRQALWRAALSGTQVPDSAFKRCLLAHHASVVKGELTDEDTGWLAQWRSRLRLAIVKANLIRRGVTMKPALDPEHPSPAYHCGRLLAVFDSLQRAALGEVGAGIIQRYYGGALSNPSGVFGQLSRMAQVHLSKLPIGLAILYEGRIAEIHEGIRRQGDHPPCYPAALTLDDQALFALGFWHQTAADNRDKTEAVAAKRERERISENNIPSEGEN